MASGPGRFALLREDVVRDRRRLFASSVFATGRLGGVTELTRDLPADDRGAQAAQADDDDGDVAVAWIEQPRSQPARVRVAVRRRGQRSFAPPQTAATARELHDVAVGLSDRGRLLVAYGRRVTRGWRIEARAGITRGRLGAAQVLGPAAGGGDLAAVAPSGRAVVAWGAQDPGIEASRPFVVSAAVRSAGARRFRSRQVLDPGELTEFPQGQARLVTVPDGLHDPRLGADQAGGQRGADEHEPSGRSLRHPGADRRPEHGRSVRSRPRCRPRWASRAGLDRDDRVRAEPVRGPGGARRRLRPGGGGFR